MTGNDLFSAVDYLRDRSEELLRRFVRSHRAAVYADLRFEVVFNRSAAANDGEPRESVESENASLGVSVWAADRTGLIGRGQVGAELGRLALNKKKLLASLAGALAEACERARSSAMEKAAIAKSAGPRAKSLSAEALAPLPAVRDEIAAIFECDPRSLSQEELRNLVRDASAAAKAVGPEIAFNAVGAMSELRDELFVSTEGSTIRQAFVFTQGDCYVVAETVSGHQEIWDAIGQQQGFESLSEGWVDELMPSPDLQTFAIALTREARELAAAPVLKPPEGEVTVVTDPHFNSLLVHEIVGHPSEADRALKMEAAYAGRSWLLRSLAVNEIGNRVGSPLLSAGSDPSLNGYGHYRYDHEGMPGRRVMHIEAGLFREFLNSRATAAILGVEPNGSARATAAGYVPLIRMSNTFFMPGSSDPQQMIGEVEHGYYVCGHHIPSIAESRENFRISARRVYEIEHGRLGRLYRAGSVVADSKSFFMKVDAVGSDLRLIAIPNCGKGQPMQVKRMSNGGPTLRSRARLVGG